MFQSNAGFRHETNSGRSPVSRQLLIDVWDLLAVIVVIALVVHIWPAQKADSDHRSGQRPSMESPLRADQLIDSTGTNSRTAAGYGYRTDSDYGPQSEPGGTERVSAESGAADKAIGRLALLQQRPGWTLVDGDIAEARRDLAMLVELGDVAIPSIRRFLRSASDVDFRATSLNDKLGYASLRLAIFDILDRIGGPVAEAIWFDELGATTNPLEIVTLGRYLDKYRPGVYDREVFLSAREALSVAMINGNSGQDIAPLFQVFKDYGDSSLIPELEQVPEMWWGRYASVTLAGLPGGAGLSSLRDRLALDSPKTNLGARFALQLLAQSAEYPEAQAALVDTVRQQQVPDALWREIASMIAGTYQFQFNNPKASVQNGHQSSSLASAHSVNKFISFGPGGNQVLYGVRYAMPQLTNAQMAQRLDLIDALLLETNSPVAQQALKQAFETIWSAFDEEGKW